MNGKEYSPFTPGSPVPVELFVGRIKQIEQILKFVKQAASGRQENVFLSGDRGIGKSSLASLLKHIVSEKEKNMLALHVFLGRVSNLEGMVKHIFEQLLKETKKESWFDNIKNLFGKYIKQVDIFGISVSFNPPAEDLKELVRNFPEALYEVIKKIKDQKKGLFIAMDDINGLAENKDFADWYKSFVDETATHYQKFPVFIMLIGLPEKRDKLAKLQPSLMRIFRPIEIEKLNDDEVKEFFIKAFNKAGMKVEEEALRPMVRYSSGLPLLMHEIGDATFWIDKDNIIDRRDAITGIFLAAENVGRKYLDPKVYRAIRSERYKSILQKLGEAPTPIERNFTVSSISKKLSEEEKRVFHNFIKRMKKLGVIENDPEGGRGSYRFVNEIYPVYIWMVSQRTRGSKKK